MYLRSTPVTRAARRICAHMVSLRRVTRRPGTAIDMKAIKAHVKNKLPSLSEKEIRLFNTFKDKKRPPYEDLLKRLGQTETKEQEWLNLTPKEKLPKPAKEFFPRPKKRSDGSYIFTRPVPNPMMATVSPATTHNQMLYKKRAYEETMQPISSTAKIQRLGPMSHMATIKGPGFTMTLPGGRNLVQPKGRSGKQKILCSKKVAFLFHI